MRKVLATASMSLDGVMQAPGGPEEDPTGGFRHGGWTVNYWDDDDRERDGRRLRPTLRAAARPQDVRHLRGALAAHQKDDPFAESLTNVKKYVVTSSRAPLKWKNSVAIHDVATDVARLKREDGPTLMTQGSSQLLQTLLKHDLVDRFTLFVFPLVLGKGKRLFGDGHDPGRPQAGRFEDVTEGRHDLHVRARRRGQARLVRARASRRPTSSRGASG